MNGLILGLGNEILCDDAIGIRVARRLAERLDEAGWEICWAEIGPLETMERLVGRDAGILIDATRVSGDPPGKVYCLPFDRLHSTVHIAWSHGIDLATAMRLGKDQGYRFPARLYIVAVNISDNYTLSETMTPDLEDNFERISAEVEAEVRHLIAETRPGGSGGSRP